MTRSLILTLLGASLLTACLDSSKSAAPVPDPPSQPQPQPSPPAPPAGPPALATLHATIPDANLAQPDPDLRIAVVWTVTAQTDAFPRRVAQETTWTRTDATSFEISITQAPPADFIQDGRASGRLLAYHDLNHNQQLDFTSVTGAAFTDELVAFDPDFKITYNDQIAGQATFDFGGSTTVTLYGDASPRLSCGLLDWIPRAEFEAGRHLAGHDLNVGPWREEILYNFTAECPDAAPPAPTTGLLCDLPTEVPQQYTASFTTKPSDFVANTCGSVMRTCQRSYPQGTPTPAGWPCPCDPAKYTCALGNLDL
jgi:hypothetical protein